jgi:hypothetical protein
MKTWTFKQYNKMLEIWDLHGPPPFVTLAAAHLDPKKKKKKGSSKSSADKTQGNASNQPEQGTMAELAAMFGIGGKKKKGTF